MIEPPESTPLQYSNDDENLASVSAIEEVGGRADALEPEIDEGSVDSPERLPGGPQFSQEEHRAKATKLLALLLFAALIFCFLIHFVAIWYFIHDKQALDEFNRVFNIWIPVLSGLFGSAATFYFTQGRK
jgi:hypothetical protein